jgi:2'-5' RNA ligase
MKPTESAVLVLIPEAESLVASHRADLDAAAGLGVPAHVTVLYPFVQPEGVDDAVMSDLAGAVRSVPAFDVTFARLRWFERSVLWLAPEPSDPFRALTAAVQQAFPSCVPYGGAHEDVVPHLTVGQGQAEELLESAARAIEPALPFSARVSSAVLMLGSLEPDTWHVVAEMPLGYALTVSGLSVPICTSVPGRTSARRLTGSASAAVSSRSASTVCALTTASQCGHAAAMPPASGS